MLSDARHGKNTRHTLLATLRQSVYGRLTGHEDVNDAERLRIDAADVDRGERGLEVLAEGEAQHTAAVAEVAAGKAVGPRGVEQKLLQPDAAAEALRCHFERLFVEKFLDLGELVRRHARRLEDLAAHPVFHGVNGQRLGGDRTNYVLRWVNHYGCSPRLRRPDHDDWSWMA